MSHTCHRFRNCYKTITFCSLLARCRIPCAYHAKPHLNNQKWPRTLSFYTFDFQICFTPQWHTFIEQLDFPKVLWTWCALRILTLKCAWRHKSVQVFISHPARWLRTRRFSPTCVGKTQCFATVLPFRAPACSFFWLFLFSLKIDLAS